MDCDQFKCIGGWGRGDHVCRSIRIDCDKFKCIMTKTCPSVLPYILSPEEHLTQILHRGSVTGNL